MVPKVNVAEDGTLKDRNGVTCGSIEKKMEADRKSKRAAALKAKRSKAGRKEKTVRSKRLQDIMAGLDSRIKADEEQFEKDKVAEVDEEEEEEDEDDQ